jgi:hypothetical protein
MAKQKHGASQFFPSVVADLEGEQTPERASQPDPEQVEESTHAQPAQEPDVGGFRVRCLTPLGYVTTEHVRRKAKEGAIVDDMPVDTAASCEAAGLVEIVQR